MPRLSFLCQKCGTGNPLSADLCQNCGTRILLIVEPPSARYEVSHASPYEEYLLERLTLYEHYVDKLTERFDKVLSLLLQQNENAYLDHTLLESAIELLTQKGILGYHELHWAWHKKRTPGTRRQSREERPERLLRKFLEGHQPAPAPPQLVAQIEEAVAWLKSGKLTPCVRQLESALLLSPNNSALLFFLGLHFYRVNKPQQALEYLARGLMIEPENSPACVLLGLLCGDAGNATQSALLLEAVGEVLKATFVIPYTRGRLHVAEGRWKEALSCFKSALKARPCAEAYYVVGCAYFQLDYFKLASRALSKAVEEDEDYASAWYGLGVLAVRAGNYTQAPEFFSAAAAADPDSERYRRAAHRAWQPGDKIKDSFDLASRRPGQKLISSGDKRLALFLRNETLRLCGSLDESQETEMIGVSRP